MKRQRKLVMALALVLSGGGWIALAAKAADAQQDAAPNWSPVSRPPSVLSGQGQPQRQEKKRSNLTVLTHRPGIYGNASSPASQGGDPPSPQGNGQPRGDSSNGSGNREQTQAEGAAGESSGKQDGGGGGGPVEPKPPVQPYLGETGALGGADRSERLDLAPVSSLVDLPISRDQAERLAAGERRPYQLLRIGTDGRPERLGRVYALFLVRKPMPGDRRKEREGVTLYRSGDEEWLPLVVDGRVVGSLVARPRVAVNYDYDADGVVDVRIAQTDGLATWLVLDTPDAWRFLEELLEGRNACTALRGSLQGRRDEARRTGFGGFVEQNRGFDLCSSGGDGAPGVGGGRNDPFEVSPRCKRVLASNSCPARSAPGGWNRDTPETVPEYLVEELKEEPVEQGAERAARWLFGRVAGAVAGAVMVTKDIGDFLVWWAHGDYRDHYVNEADKELHEFERYVRRGWGSVERAERDNVRPRRRILRAACAAGSQSVYCGGRDALGERSELPEDKKRSYEYWEQVTDEPGIDGSRPGQNPVGQPIPDRESPGRTPAQVQCDACLAEAAYKRLMQEALDDARSRCADPSSQPNPAAQGASVRGRTGGEGVTPSNPVVSWLGGAGRAGEHVECAAHGNRDDETRTPSIEDLTRAVTGCNDPTARPGGGEGGKISPRCRFRPGANANLPTIGIAFGTVIGLGACPNEVCQESPDRL